MGAVKIESSTSRNNNAKFAELKPQALAQKGQAVSRFDLREFMKGYWERSISREVDRL